MVPGVSWLEPRDGKEHVPRAGPADNTTPMDLIGPGRSLAQTWGAETHALVFLWLKNCIRAGGDSHPIILEMELMIPRKAICWARILALAPAM